ncbi:hypothetical protein GCM10028862_03970 [Luteimonas pelagia]
MTTPCPACHCIANAPAHAVVAALLVDDVDRAIEGGLLDDIACDMCDAACRARVTEARHARRSALAARERYRERQVRLARRAAERDAQRRGAADPTAGPGAPAELPKAASDALARALARAAKPD